MDALLAAQADHRILNYGADPFAGNKELQKFHIYATDGHSIGASAHELPIQGKKRAVNLNKRTMNALVLHLDRSTQNCLQFIRWLRASLIKNYSYRKALQKLRPLMLRYLK